MSQAYNPYLPSYEYIPDAEPHIFNDRVYIYGSHDKFNGRQFCLLDYVTWSAPIDDLSDWRYEGVIFRKKWHPKKYFPVLNSMAAPDCCQGTDGRYYLYYFVGRHSLISVAVSDSPTGPFKFIDYVRYKDGKTIGSKKEPLQFDPGIFVDDDKRVYLYTGFGTDKATPSFFNRNPTEEGAMCFELEEDMITVKGEMSYIGVPAKKKAKGTPYEDHPFFEASSMRKFNNRYYFIYSSSLGHELCYAVSDSPKGPFSFGGTLVSNGDIGLGDCKDPKTADNFTGNTHGSLININGQYYVFYHRQTNRHQFSRQACAEKLYMREDGGFDQVLITSCGLNKGPLQSKGTYEARIACVLKAPKGNRFYFVTRGLKGKEPYFTQTGKDRNEDPDQYIANIHDKAVIGYRYFDFKDVSSISVTVKGNGKGKLHVYDDEKLSNEVSVIDIKAEKEYKAYKAQLHIENGVKPLFFRYEGKGSLDFKEFTLE